MAITTAQIHAAADQIDKEGKRPTLASVRTVLGGGSFSTIQEAMKTWSKKADDEETTAEPVPQEVQDEGEKFTAAMWQLAEKHAATAFDLERQAHAAAKARDAAELADAIQAADEQADRANGLLERLTAALKERDDLTYELVNTESRAAKAEEQHRLTEAIAEERARTIKTLEHLVNKTKPAQPTTKPTAPKLRPAAEIFATKPTGNKNPFAKLADAANLK